METSLILSIIISLTTGILLFLLQRSISNRDKEIEKIKEQINYLERQGAVSASKIEDIKVTMERIYDKINE